MQGGSHRTDRFSDPTSLSGKSLIGRLEIAADPIDRAGRDLDLVLNLGKRGSFLASARGNTARLAARQFLE
jgi:hypothetical protein